MKQVIRVINKTTESINIGLDGGVEILAGNNEYKLSKDKVNEVVRAASFIDGLEVQLVASEEDDSPSTVDAKSKIADLTNQNKELEDELKTVSSDLKKAQDALEGVNLELEKAKAEIQESKAALAGGDKNEGVTEPKKATTKRTKTQTENKE
jgi:chromosome segregation ATPase